MSTGQFPKRRETPTQVAKREERGMKITKPKPGHKRSSSMKKLPGFKGGIRR